MLHIRFSFTSDKRYVFSVAVSSNLNEVTSKNSKIIEDTISAVQPTLKHSSVAAVVVCVDVLRLAKRIVCYLLQEKVDG